MGQENFGYLAGYIILFFHISFCKSTDQEFVWAIHYLYSFDCSF